MFTTHDMEKRSGDMIYDTCIVIIYIYNVYMYTYIYILYLYSYIHTHYICFPRASNMFSALFSSTVSWPGSVPGTWPRRSSCDHGLRCQSALKKQLMGLEASTNGSSKSRWSSSGWWDTPLKNDGIRQLGSVDSQYMVKHVPNHQPDSHT